MRIPVLVSAVLLAAAASAFTLHLAQPDATARINDQRDAMKALANLDGAWRGTAWTILPNGQKHTITQTERVGPFLDGAVRVVEGRGYEHNGTVSFNALGIISYNPDTAEYSMRSYAQGHAGDFSITVNEDGFSWEIPAGPVTIRYHAVIDETTWHETGDRIMDGRDPVRFFEMTLTRLGDSNWPSADAIPHE